ncbi:unnamed protein product [Blepharisma stoltei]|uniref:Uncharacterized protein n=1 Tax=Blepharisma stoltei TaxID=1481888 RepID=A0AAU9JGF2_9CILI|nr:unnamed protein product [Blepharisma stoltei]
MTQPIGELGKDVNFFPLTGLQFGKWLSAFHLEKQIFLFYPKNNTFVFLAVHPKEIGQINSSFLMPLSRKQLLKQFGKNSPFAAPAKRKDSLDAETIGINLISKLSADYGGVIAFEVEFEDIVGLDYCNTLVYYGSRIVIEAKKGKKRWFCSVKEFCNFYEISTNLSYKSSFYTPILDWSKTYFATKQMYPIEENRDPLFLDVPRQSEKLPAGVVPSHSRCISEQSEYENTPDDNFDGFDRARSEASSSDCEYEIHKDEGKEFKNKTIVAYFDDPVFPFFIRDVIRKPENSNLLKMYERGIPSWAVFLPSYGLPYRPWMRRSMALIIFCFSLMTMLLGFYDLYKNIPRLREALHLVFGDFFEMFEEAIVLRLSMLFGYLLASSQYFQSFIGLLVYPFQMVWSIVNSLLLVKYVTLGIYTILQAILFIFIQLKDFTFITFSLPFDIIWGITYLIWQILRESYYFTTGLILTIRSTTNIVRANKEAVEAAKSLSILIRIKNSWQTAVGAVVKGATSIYNFTVYSSINLYKHKDSAWMSWEKYYRRNHAFIRLRVFQVFSFMLLWALVKYTYRHYYTSQHVIN